MQMHFIKYDMEWISSFNHIQSFHYFLVATKGKTEKKYYHQCEWSVAVQ